MVPHTVTPGESTLLLRGDTTMLKRASWACAGALILPLLTGGCAGGMQASTAEPLPPAKALQASDLAGLAGDWQGTMRGTTTTGPASAGRSAILRVTIAPDGSFTSNIDGMPGTGRGRI